MIISTVNGNLIERAKSGHYWGIAHGANCQNTMRSGIAPKICAAFQGTREADEATVKGDVKKLGTYSESFDKELSMMVFNMYTQFDFRGRNIGIRDLDYNAVANAFTLLNSKWSHVQHTSNRLFGIPMIGSGLAGGDWDAIKEIINLVTPDIIIEVVFLQ